MNRQDVTDVEIFPYYPGVSLEVTPVISKGTGSYCSGQFMQNAFHQLTLENADIVGDLHIGATYSWSGRDADGNAVNSHWLICTENCDNPTFGVIRGGSQTAMIAPLLTDLDSSLIQLEELMDIVAVLRQPHNNHAQSQLQLGKSGWLVQTTVTAPSQIGILIAEPNLPPSFPEGAANISISAKSTRTLQTIGLDNLTCAKAGDTALFLRSSVDL